MALKEDIVTRVKEILDANFEYEEISYVPDISDSKLTFGNKGLQFEANVLHIDLRDSTKLLNKHNRPTLAKIHKAYFQTIIAIAELYNGEIRSFNGDSMLVFFEGNNKNTLNDAVKSAMQMKYMLYIDDGGVSTKLRKYTSIDFGIGIDFGKVLCAKFGKGGDSNKKDLVWLGNAVNKSVKLSDAGKYPSHIHISKTVYQNLNDDLKYHIEKNLLGFDERFNMWSSGFFVYNDNWETSYYTNYHWKL